MPPQLLTGKPQDGPRQRHAESVAGDPELQFLLNVADPRPAASGSLGSESGSNLDWDRLLEMALWHGLAPRLYDWLSRNAERVPVPIMERLRNLASSSLKLNLHLARELFSLSAQLRSASIPHIVYKGPLLASMLYGNLALRTSSDLDLVVPAPEVDHTRDLLLAMGFVDRYSLAPAQQAAAFRFGCEHGFTSPDTSVTVDLHWRVVPKYVSHSLDMAAMFDRAVDVPLFGHDLPTFCPEDLLFVLCLHAGQHEWAHLSLFTDIIQVIEQYPHLDWHLFNRHLADSNTRRMVNVSLALAQTWPMELPASIVADISADVDARRLSDKVRTHFWPSRVNPVPKDADMGWLAERSRGEPLLERLRWIAGWVLNPTLADFTTFSLPSALIPLYPALRAGRLLVKRTGLGRPLRRQSIPNQFGSSGGGTSRSGS